MFGCRDLADEVLAPDSFETDFIFAGWAVFDISRKEYRAHMIVKAAEHQGSWVASWKRFAGDHKFVGDLDRDFVETLALGSGAQTGDAEYRNQNTQALLSHKFSFERL
jgi:hypothetical protein